MANFPISDLEPLCTDGLKPFDLHHGVCTNCGDVDDVMTICDEGYCIDCADECFDADGEKRQKPAVYDLMARCSKCNSFDLATIFGDRLLCQICFESDELPPVSKAEAFVKYAAVAVIGFAFGIYVAAEVVLNIVRANQ